MNIEDKLYYRLIKIEHLVERLYRHLGSPEKPPPYLELEDKPFGSYRLAARGGLEEPSC